jgi:hypothetical protein
MVRRRRRHLPEEVLTERNGLHAPGIESFGIASKAILLPWLNRLVPCISGNYWSTSDNPRHCLSEVDEAEGLGETRIWEGVCSPKRTSRYHLSV